MNDINVQLLKTIEFYDWFDSQSPRIQNLILARLNRISISGHFGSVNYFDGLIELKWKSGLRIYTARIGQTVIIVLGGENKNGQSKDIKQAKKILSQIKSTYTHRS